MTKEELFESYENIIKSWEFIAQLPEAPTHVIERNIESMQLELMDEEMMLYPEMAKLGIDVGNDDDIEHRAADSNIMRAWLRKVRG